MSTPLPFNAVDVGSITVLWTEGLDGGGRALHQPFVSLVRELCGPVDRAFDFCAGPGFIGFSLLASGLCKSLCLSDINHEAVTLMRQTAELNGLQDRVDVYHSDCLADIPIGERWDLVVANPPHFNNGTAHPSEVDIIRCDPDWALHRRFYDQVGRHLSAGAHVILAENLLGSTPDLFVPMATVGGLEYVRSVGWAGARTLTPIYFTVSKARDVSALCDVSPTRPNIPIRLSQVHNFMAIDSPSSAYTTLALINDESRPFAVLFQTGGSVDLALRLQAHETKRVTLLLPAGTCYLLCEPDLAV